MPFAGVASGSQPSDPACCGPPDAAPDSASAPLAGTLVVRASRRHPSSPAAGAGPVSAAVSGPAADAASPAGVSSCPARPVSKARNPGGVQASAAARPSGVTSPGASARGSNAASIASASSAFLSFDRAAAQASPSVARATSRIRTFGMRIHTSAALHTGFRFAPTTFAKSKSSRATVASTSGRAEGSKASWGLSVRAMHEAKRLRFLRSGSARMSANPSAGGHCSQSSAWTPRSTTSSFSPTLTAANSASPERTDGRSRVTRTAMSRGVVVVAAFEDGPRELEESQVEGGLEVAGELGLDDGGAKAAQIVREPDADARPPSAPPPPGPGAAPGLE